jgi:hypothetical protein
MDEFEIKNRIAELRSLIASNWTSVKERKRMYEELERLECEIRRINNACNSENG